MKTEVIQLKKILVLGGTRFFGKKLVSLLVNDGHDVTIATRGNTADNFGNQVKRLLIDREDAESVRSAVGAIEWDIVYDNICYSPQEAQDACNVFAGKTKHYILTSTLSVYGFGKEKKKEEDFDPYTYSITMGGRDDFAYDEGKRLAEAVFFQKADFPVSAVRFPIVLGTDDYTKRLHFHIEHVRDGIPIGMPNQEAVMSFINSDEAAAFLRWLGNERLDGPVNACSKGEYSLKEVLSLIENEVGKDAIIQENVSQEHKSPFGISDSWYMDTAKAEQAGYVFQPVTSWLPELVHELSKG